jgi:replicative DNA helicase
LAGLIESDGWVQNASVQFSSASEKLANDVIKLTRSLGGQGILSIKEKPVYAYKGGKRIGRPSYKVSIICPEIESIINSPRILKNLTKRRKSIEPIVRKITFLRSDYAQCISVTHDKSLYITNDYTMTHNTSVLLNFANSHTEQCGIISTEQPAEQIASRLISINGRVNSSRMRNGTLEEYDWTKITNSVHHLHVNNNIWINDKPGINILELIRQARKWKHQYDIKALYIDYIQRIKWTDLRLAKWEQVGNVVMSLKELGRDLDIPVIALAQVNRDVEKRGNARPNMGDLANSSEIEKEADVIMTLYRDEVYIKDSDQKGIMEINVCKNRHGPTGTAMVAWNEKCMRIDDLVPQTYQKNQANH